MPIPISATRARKEFFKILKNVGSVGRVYSVRLIDHPDVILMSQDEYEGWQETLDIMSDPKLVRRLERARKDIRSGKCKLIPWEDVKKSLKL